MADISKITIESGTYDIKDVVAREQIELLNNNKTIFIGDSYGVGVTNTSDTITSWIDYIISRYYTGSYKYAVQGAGFYMGSTRFIDILNNAINDITDRNSITSIVVCGGFNDRNTTPSNIEGAMNTFITTAKTYFTNAKIYIGMIGGSSIVSTTGSDYRLNTFNKVLPSYKNCIKYGAIYLNGVEQILKNYSYFSDDGIHPNANGYSMLADGINQALKTGSYSICTGFESFEIDDHINGNIVRNGNVTMIDIEGYVNYNGVATGKDITLGTLDSDFYRVVNQTMASAIPCRFHWETSDSTYYGGFGYILIGHDGSVVLNNHLYTNTGDSYPDGIRRIENVTKLVIDFANKTIDTDLC